MNVGASRRYVWWVVLLLFFVNIMNYGQRMALSVLLPSIKRDIALTDTQLGILIGGAFALLYATAGVPLAQWASRRSRRNWLAAALALWSAMTIAFGLMHSYVQMLFARVGLGLAQSLSTPCSHSIMLDHVSEHRRSTALGLHATGAVAGITLLGMLTGWLEGHVGWRLALVAIALPGLLLAIVVRLSLREAPLDLGQGAAVVLPTMTLGDAVRHLAGNRFYLLIVTGVCIAMLVEYGTSQWMPSYYVRRYDVPVPEVAFKYGLVYGIGGIPGCVIGGIVADRLARRDVRWIAWMPAATYAIAVPIGLSVLLAQSFAVALALNTAYVFLIQSTNGAMLAACYASVPSQMRATTAAVTYLLGGLTGIALGPVLVGGVSDLLPPAAAAGGLQMSLIAVECLAFGVVLSMALATRHAPGPVPAAANTVATTGSSA